MKQRLAADGELIDAVGLVRSSWAECRFKASTNLIEINGHESSIRRTIYHARMLAPTRSGAKWTPLGPTGTVARVSRLRTLASHITMGMSPAFLHRIRSMEYFADYALFLAKSITVLVVVLIVLVAIANMAQRGRRPFDGGRIETRRLNDVLDDMRDALRGVAFDEKALKKLAKDEAKAEKARRKAEEKGEVSRPRTWVISFDGDVAASAVRALRNEVTAILTLAEPGDEVLACIESPGGMVHGYGLAASQLHRLRAAQGVALTVAVDKVAASGGYMMACIGERILAAPFAIVGSIGVVAQVPNVHRLLKKNDVDVDVITAGEFKRTLTVFGENTEKGREKFVEEIEDVHSLFKAHVVEHRPSLEIERVATGEAWHGRQAIDLGLVDELMTSDEFIVAACAEREVYEVKWTEPRSLADRVVQQAAHAAGAGIERLFMRWRDRFNWVG